MTDDGSGFRESTAINLNVPPDSKTYHPDQYPSWFPDDRHLAFTSSRAESADIWVADSLRKEAPVPFTAEDFIAHHFPAVGPDGSVVYAHGEPDRDLYVLDRAGGRERRLTSGSWQDTDPDHSPSGDDIVFARGGSWPDQTSLDTRLAVMTSKGKDLRYIPLEDMPNAQDPAWVARLGSP